MCFLVPHTSHSHDLRMVQQVNPLGVQYEDCMVEVTSTVVEEGGGGGACLHIQI